jgi:ABC-2 type transport system permease protein
MNLKRSFILARRVIQELASDRRTVALILIIPLIVLTVAGILVRAGTTSVSIGVVLNDQGANLPLGLGNVNIGQRLTDNLGKVADNIHVQTLDADSAQTQLNSGDLDAIITFPPDFSQQTVNNRALNFDVSYEGSNPMASRLLDGFITRGAVTAMASMSTLASGAQTPPQINIHATYRYGSADFDSLDYIAPVFIGLFEFLFVFILTSVAFLRERASGTLERLQATPIRFLEIVLGYMFGFALFALIQALIILLFTIYGLKVHFLGSLLNIFVIEILLALMAVNLGIFFSTFARNEFQIVQFIPLVVVTQILLSGAFWAVKDMPGWLQPFAWLMPLTYANTALRDIMIKGFTLIDIWPLILGLTAFAALFVLMAVQTIRRQANP